MDRFDRIYDLHKLLSSSRYPVSREKIEQELECSRATAKRIIDNMRLYLDAPIKYDRHLNGYYYERKQDDLYELPGLWFNASELHALLTIQQLLSSIEPGLFEKQLAPLLSRIDKLLETQNTSSQEINHRVIIVQMAARSSGEFFQPIAGAVMQRKRLLIDYYNRATRETLQREVSPQRLVYYRDNWYLDAWCHLRNGLRTFALDAIHAARILSADCKNLSDENLDAHFNSSYGIFSGAAKDTAVLHFSPAIANWISQESWHPQQQGRFLENGSYELSLPYNNPTELIMDILRYGADVQVMKPAALRQQIIEKLGKALAQYAD